VFLNEQERVGELLLRREKAGGAVPSQAKPRQGVKRKEYRQQAASVKAVTD
jgi:hypothetical protein